MNILLAILSIGCLFHVLIAVLIVAIVVAIILWVISYLGLPIPPLVSKLIVVLGVVICVYYIVVCLTGGVVP